MTSKTFQHQSPSPPPPPPAPNAFSADLVHSSASAIATLATEALFKARPGARERFNPHAAMKWKEGLVARLSFLSTALATGQPRVFVDHILWSKTAHATRGGAETVGDLRASMDALAHVLANELPPPHASVAAEIVRLALREFDDAPEMLPSLLNPNDPRGRLSIEFLAAILEGDRRRACDLVLACVSGQPSAPTRLSVEELYADVLIPVQREIGRLWHLNDLTVGEEHFATATTQMVMSLVYPYLKLAPRINRTLVAGSVEGNAHELGVRMLADLLDARGWKVVYLGPNIPADDLAIAVEAFDADLAAISASIATQIVMVERTVQAIRARSAANGKPVKILVGGSGFIGCNDLWRHVGADGFAESFERGVELAASLVGLNS